MVKFNMCLLECVPDLEFENYENGIRGRRDDSKDSFCWLTMILRLSDGEEIVRRTFRVATSAVIEDMF